MKCNYWYDLKIILLNVYEIYFELYLVINVYFFCKKYSICGYNKYLLYSVYKVNYGSFCIIKFFKKNFEVYGLIVIWDFVIYKSMNLLC